MKRIFAALIAIALLAMIPIVTASAAGNSEPGEMLIAQDPEKVQGAVGEIVKVNFYLYPNLPDGRKLDSLSGTMKYDPEFVSLGSINQVDEEANLKSLMKGKASSFQYKIEDNGILRFAYIDAYGIETEGFWFQAEFRIEKEGATDFVFNGITYTGIDSSYKAVTFMIDPVSVGGVYTEGQNVPEDGAAEETFAPLTPAVETPAVITPTPKPSNGGQTVPVTSSLPTYSVAPAPTGIVTPPPAVTQMPVVTPAPHDDTPAPQADTPAPAVDTPVPQQQDPIGDTTPAPDAEPVSDDPTKAGGPEASAFPIGGDEIVAETTDAPNAQNDPTSQPGADDGAVKNDRANEEEKDDSSDIWLIVGIVAGMVAVLGLGALAIVILMKRRKMNQQ